MEYYSHKNPDKLLYDHLLEVYHYAMKANVELKNWEKEALQIICLCHDFGKFTTFFQSHLSGVSSKHSQHGFLSAIFGVFCWMQKKGLCLQQMNPPASLDEVISLLIYACILHHHGDVKDISKNLPEKFKGDFKADINLVQKIDDAYVQIEDLRCNAEDIKPLLEKIGLGNKFEKFLAQQRGFIEDILRYLKRIEYGIRMIGMIPQAFKDGTELYFAQQKLYSLLIWADKMSAANYKLLFPCYASSDRLIVARDKVIKPTQDKNLQRIRQSVFEAVLSNIEKNKEKDIFSITTPTGTGKTLAGVFAALKLKEILEKSGRIIYALPFTSIIDQNYHVVENLFKAIEDFEKNRDRYLLKHHHLTDVEFRGKEGALKEITDEITVFEKVASECFIENWTSGFVVTTFVQLLETLISNRNRMLKKFHTFYDSVLLLDEIQAIDVELLPLVEEVLKKLTQLFRCKIILMTATKPLIFEDACELAGFCDYSIFNRTKLMYHHSDLKVAEFVDFFLQEVYEDEKSFLIVANTINQSHQIYNGIKNNLKNKEVIYLSASLVPKDRKDIIKKIEKMLESGAKPIVVSTQVIEAGVDIDFDCVVRDIAPIDSIIQCAGRCNRHNEKSQGSVLVVNMKDESGITFAKRVYGNTAIEISRGLLLKHLEVEEKDYGMLIDSYFRMIKENKSFKKSDEFLKAIRLLKFDSILEKEELTISRFSLIQQRGGYVSVIIRSNEEIEDAYQRYIDSFSIKDYYERREIYLKLKNILFEYTISVPIKYAQIFDEEKGILSLPPTSCQRYYSPKTGFVYDPNDHIIFA
ncbi:CRISPR-associated helicase Cas3' [Anaerocellum diazotrophicum]|uniref:CRISPR-associated helicase/endonuclease Cas3 n=1 Tax=Caldicellulosiruptor diazotrophicus TaxID=2806205 RepID=A0ABM7NQP0_9FIRM|nr:CRISPR-associated helicase Cas3' [Caldicellulosiruptor diazotrophicus]BCS82391.1 CRISPR-associated helicase/endonuclease Cas3 [Caldicellulosiruptor diazotrophicus]